MDIVEKLVDLFYDNNVRCDQKIEGLADDVIDIIANGVTVQEWISVKDKLPPYNHDVLVYRPDMAMKIVVDNYAGYYGEDDDEWHEGWALYGRDTHGNHVITHWAYLPHPPKENDYEAD